MTLRRTVALERNQRTALQQQIKQTLIPPLNAALSDSSCREQTYGPYRITQEQGSVVLREKMGCLFGLQRKTVLDLEHRTYSAKRLYTVVLALERINQQHQFVEATAINQVRLQLEIHLLEHSFAGRLGLPVVSSRRHTIDERRAMLQLHRKKQEHQRFLHALPILVHVVDPSLIVCSHSLGLHELYEAPETDMTGRSIFDIFPFLAPIKKKVGAQYQRVFETGQPSETEETHNFQGKEVVVRVQRLPVCDDQGRVNQVMTVVYPITRERQLERVQDTLFAVLPDVLILFDAQDDQMRILACNQATVREFRVDTGEIAGRTLAEVLPDLRTSMPTMEAAFQRLRTTGEPVTTEVQRVPAGAEQWYEMRAFPVFGETIDGQPAVMQVLAVIRNITAVKKAERTIEQQRRRLRALLFITRRLIHDVGNNLAIITTASFLMANKITRNTSSQDLATEARAIDACAKRMNELIQDSRTLYGYFENPRRIYADLEALDISALINSMVSARKIGTNVRIESSANQTVISNPAILRTIIDEFLVNAEKYTPGNQAISITVFADDTKRKWGIRCSNPGVTVASKEEVARLFDEGVRGQHVRDARGTGTGLFSNLVLAQLLGGTMSIEVVTSGKQWTYTAGTDEVFEVDVDGPDQTSITVLFPL